MHTPPSPPPPERLFEWDRSTTIGLAKASCSWCHGYGMRPVFRANVPEIPCACVFRGVYRVCLRRVVRCQEMARSTGGAALERGVGYGRKREEFAADFCLISRRTLDDAHFAIQRLHHIEGREYGDCCRLLHIDRGTFFHRVYYVEEQVGRALAETEPYALYPVAEYFAGTFGGVNDHRHRGIGASSWVPRSFVSCAAGS